MFFVKLFLKKVINIQNKILKMYYYIYKITCTQGSFKDMYYIGQHRTNNLDDGYKGSGSLLKKYYKKFPDGYIKEILCFCKDEIDLNQSEKQYIGDKYDTDPKCLNLCPGGGVPPILYGDKNGFYGKHHSSDTKQKQSACIKNYYKTHDGFWKNKHLPKNVCDKISNIKKQQKIWSGNNNPWFNKHRYGKENPFYGKHHSPESKLKMSKKVIIDDIQFNSYTEAAKYLNISCGFFSKLKKNSCTYYKDHKINW